ncbi:hypothetical protein PVAP13_8KG172600 [Panicum virgatum]|uniref:Uncharacterized protein n=1 Tax=Panicum virgatum TaxID=38727 RepID=A0A8T0PKP0_PANVG|nr:hypothetical protein PVAP13_8KG172600 [Panicum virgatum]
MLRRATIDPAATGACEKSTSSSASPFSSPALAQEAHSPPTLAPLHPHLVRQPLSTTRGRPWWERAHARPPPLLTAHEPRQPSWSSRPSPPPPLELADPMLAAAHWSSRSPALEQGKEAPSSGGSGRVGEPPSSLHRATPSQIHVGYTYLSQYVSIFLGYG